MMRKMIYLKYLFLFIFSWQFSVAQVGIGTTTPVASSLLDLTSTTKGMLAPRMTLAQKTAISSPATGLLVYQTDGSSGFWYYTGSAWVPFDNGWKILGNSGTVAGTNFIGTTDAIDFVTKTNNTERMRILSAGSVGIGTTTTATGSLVDVKGHLALSNGGTASELRFYEPSGSGTNYTGFKTQAQAADITYTLPETQGATNTVLTNDGTGILKWGMGHVQFAAKAADESVTSSTTLQDDNEFTFTLGTNQMYEITGMIKASCSSTGLIKMQFVAPAGSSEFIIVFTNRSAADDVTYLTNPATAYQVSTTTVSSTTDVIMLNGTVTTAGTGGTFKIQWAQQASHGTATTFYQNSYVKVTSVQ